MNTEKQLLAVAQSDNRTVSTRATEEILSRYARLVHRISRRYYRPGMHLELEDLAQAGRLGLLLAIRKFDITLGRPFGGYACGAITNEVRRCIQQTGRGIYLPTWITEQLGKIKRERDRLTITLGRVPTDKELAKCLRMSAETLRELLTTPAVEMSLDENATHDVSDVEETVGETIADEDSDFAHQSDLQMLLEEVMTKVPDADILDMRTRGGYTYGEIAAETGCSEPTIRRREQQACQQVRAILRQEIGGSSDDTICARLLGSRI